jgi:hypothetical protein
MSLIRAILSKVLRMFAFVSDAVNAHRMNWIVNHESPFLAFSSFFCSAASNLSACKIGAAASASRLGDTATAKRHYAAD